MIIGVDPKYTGLSVKERDKIVVKTLEELEDGVLHWVLRYPDGDLDVNFDNDSRYGKTYHVRKGLVWRNGHGKPAKSSRAKILLPCREKFKDKEFWSTNCHVDCGCPCIEGQGYSTSVPWINPYQMYRTHCKDFNETDYQEFVKTHPGAGKEL